MRWTPNLARRAERPPALTVSITAMIANVLFATRPPPYRFLLIKEYHNDPCIILHTLHIALDPSNKQCCKEIGRSVFRRLLWFAFHSDNALYIICEVGLIILAMHHWCILASHELPLRLEVRNATTKNYINSSTLESVSRKIFSNAFYWMKMCEFRIGFHVSLFLGFELIVFQHSFR